MLLEREPQLAALDEYAAETRRGEGRLVLVSGEAGVGKSALIEECERRQTGATWSWGSCDGLFTPRPLGPLLDIATQLGGPLLATTESGSTREEIFQAVLTELAAGPAATVLVFEDVHWADEATLDLLRFVGKRIRTLPALVLVTYRDDEVAPGHPLRRCLAQLSTERSIRRVDVPRLTPAGVGTLAEGSGLAPDELHHLTSGNPFFLTEVLRDPSSRLPASAREAVLGRVDSLTRPARRALDVAALLGARVDLALLEALAAPPPEVVDELVDTGLLVADGQVLRFRHEITRRTVEDSLPPHRSSPLHGQILALLKGRDSSDDARLAYHAEGASDAVAAQAHATLAARRAAALGAHREAAAQYERALRWAGAGDDRTRALLLDGLADEYGLLDRWDDSLETRETALELWRAVGDRIREGDAVRRLSKAHWRLCQGPEAVAAALEAVELLEPHGDTEELARALAGAAAQYTGPHNEAALALAERALAIAERQGLLDLVSDLLNTISCVQQLMGRPWQDTMERALAMALQAGADTAVGRGYANLQAMATATLDFAAAERAHDLGLEYCEGHDIPTYANCLVGGQVAVFEATGRFDEAVALGLGRMAAAELSPVNRLGTHITLGKIFARRGDAAAAWEQLDTALADGTALGEPEYLVLIHLARAEAHWLEGHHDAALAACLMATEGHDQVDAASRGLLDTWLVRLGCEPVPGPVEAPYAAQIRGDVGAAVAAWEEVGGPYDAALALLDSHDEAHWREAVARFDALGAEATARVARRRLRDAGARQIPAGARRTTRAHPRGLTRREQEVLRELCLDLTNEEIAARLVISAKTVDHHVSSVLGKLGVANRRAAIAEARRLGLLREENAQRGEPVVTT